jgi:anthranilate synthase component 1
MFYPSLSEFIQKAKTGNLIPVYKEILADLETPVSAFLKIRDGRFSYLLESVVGGEKWARYSFLGSRPSVILRGVGNGVEIIRNGRTERITGFQNPLEVVRKFMSQYRAVPVAGLPRFFGGAVGYLSYDLVRYFDEIPQHPKPGLGFPNLFLMITDTLLIFDSLTQKIKIVSNAHVGDDPPKKAYDAATAKIDQIIKKLEKPTVRRRNPRAAKRMPKIQWRSNMTPKSYEKMVLKAKEYISAGDIFQGVLSQRFGAGIHAEPFDIYRALRVINPSPYMYYLQMDDLTVAGSSPEVLVRCEEGKIELRPIAGTRRRGTTDIEDQNLMEELLADQKERAEHLMLVDLGRNDVGRVAEMGRVSVDELMVIEKYSHVMHLVSHVQGQLAQGKDAYDVMRACFPAGTVSGAPKIRAMQIIDELEPTQRGLYAGAVGYFSFSGNMDTCINIRTIVTDGHQAYVQAGGGIVADSHPRREYEETVNKAKAVMAAVEMAEKGLS